MSAYLYDEAIVNNLRHVIGDNRIQILSVDRVADIIPRLNDDKLVLPLVTLTRTNWTILASESNHSAKYEGGTAKVYPGQPKFNTTRIQKVQFVPMQIDYAIDIWTRTRRENDEFVRELFWYFMISPTLEVTVPYALDFNHNFNIYIDDTVEDNSDIAQHQLKGEYFRQTLHIYTDDAKLWKSTERNPTTVTIQSQLVQAGLEEAATDLTTASEPTDIQ